MTSNFLKCHESPENSYNYPFPDEIDDYNRYLPGQISYEFDPSKEKYKHMLHLIAYDIRDSKRLHKVAKICEDYGFRVEYSVFECDLDEKNFQDLWERLNKIIDPDEDCIITYKICSSCVSKITSVGVAERPGKVLLYIL